MNTCLDEGMLQAYMDGELSHAQMEACAAHLSSCATCAELAHEAEHEYALFSTALAPLVNVPPPTAALRARLDDAIADLQAPPRYVPESKPSRLRAWWSAVTASFIFNPRYAGAFATFLLAIALTVVLTMMRPKQGPVQVAQVKPTEQPGVIKPTPTENPITQPTVTEPTPTSKVNKPENVNRSNAAGFVNAGYKTPVRRGQNANNSIATRVAPQAQPVPLLPEEKNYMRTIATLDAAIKAQGQAALPPTLRAELERNLAVVDQSIIATRIAVRRNPQDADAKEFLRAAYQNKVDLLTTVADQTRYIAARD